MTPYLIFVTNAANVERVKFSVECKKKNPEKREYHCFELNLYHNIDHVNVLFYTMCAILHLMGRYIYMQWYILRVVLHSTLCSSTPIFFVVGQICCEFTHFSSVKFS